MTSSLSLQGLRLKVRLGCHENERREPQFVRFHIRLRFPTPPGGCHSDSLEETVCYARLSECVRSVCERQEYRLIEKLGWDVYDALRAQISPQILIWVCTTKEKPPIVDLEEGASFTLSDWLE